MYNHPPLKLIMVRATKVYFKTEIFWFLIDLMIFVLISQIIFLKLFEFSILGKLHF